jgi:ribosomal protein L37E
MEQMATGDLTMRCQRCGDQMEMRDPAPGGDWKPDQFWVCPRCGRHFWTTYAAPPKPAGAATAAPASPAAGPAAPTTQSP